MKWVGMALVDELETLNSPIPYGRARSCCEVVEQEDGTLTSTYCRSRWCLVCNRIRTGTLINRYLPILRLWEQDEGVHFVTLTPPNVEGNVLREAVQEMKKQLRYCRRSIRETRGMDFRAVENWEVTHNADRGDYNPHVHVAVRGKEQAAALREEWLKRWSEASEAGQDVRKWDGSVNGMKELAKYATKMIHPDRNERPPVEVLDTIFRALHRLNLCNPTGFDVEEERRRAGQDVEDVETGSETTARPELDEQEEDPFDDLEAVIPAYSDPHAHRIWEWDGCDWVDPETGEYLTEWEPSDDDRALVTSPEDPPEDPPTVPHAANDR
jgi:hypothetical protein